MPIPAAAANAYAALARMGEQTEASPATLPAGGRAEFRLGAQRRDRRRHRRPATNRTRRRRPWRLGKANMIDVVTAVAESEIAVQALVSVRDKVIAAYEEILKMPI